MGVVEVWGPKEILDPLADFFIRSFVRNVLVELAPQKLNATWRNQRAGENRVAKRLDRFLVSERLTDSLSLLRQWVGCGGISDHSPIFLELKGGTTKPPSPFKFHLGWLLDESYLKLVTSLWVPYNVRLHGHAAVHFMENLKKIKGATKDWAKEKRVRDEKELLDVEYSLQSLMKDGDGGFSSEECKVELLGLEKHR